MTFVFAPIASLMVAFRLTADRPDQRTISALLYAAMTQTADQPHGGVPDEVRLYESAASFAPPLRRVCDSLGIPLRSTTSRNPATGEVERFFETLHKRVGEALPGFLGTVLGNGAAYLTLHELEDVLKDCLTEYHRSANSETGQSPLTFWQTHCFPSPADPHRLAKLLGEGIHRTILGTGIQYYARWYWHDELASLPPGTGVLIYPTPSLSIPESVEVFLQDTWICTALVSRC